MDPNNLRALTFETYFRLAGADSITDPAAKQAALDKAADYAQKGLAATKPADMSDADFATLQGQAKPVFYRAIATAALNKKDAATAVTNFKLESGECASGGYRPSPVRLLQDTYELGQAYYQMTPPDYVNCTWYASRAAAFAPEPYKSADDAAGEVLLQEVPRRRRRLRCGDWLRLRRALNPPADFKIKPAPSPADIVANVIATTPDLSTLAVSDKEFILANGKPEDAAKVWDTIKGKSVQIPDALVIESSPTVLKVAVSDDAVQSKTADFTFNMAPLDEGKTACPGGCCQEACG